MFWLLVRQLAGLIDPAFLGASRELPADPAVVVIVYSL
jgi:hypothetical protein